MVGVVEDLDGREADADLAAESLVAEVSRLPVLAPVCENGQAGNRTTIAIVEAVVVGEQAFGEIGVVLALDFDVDVDLWFSMVVCSEPSDHDNAAERAVWPFVLEHGDEAGPGKQTGLTRRIGLRQHFRRRHTGNARQCASGTLPPCPNVFAFSTWCDYAIGDCPPLEGDLFRRFAGIVVVFQVRCRRWLAGWLANPNGLLQAGTAACSDLSTVIIHAERGAHVIDFRRRHDVLLFLPGQVVAGQAQLRVDTLGSQQVRHRAPPGVVQWV